MKKILSLVLALAMLMTLTSAMATSVDEVGGMPANWWVDANLQPSQEFYVDGGMTVTMLGIHYNQYPTTFDGGYYLPSVEAKTGVHFDIDWRTSDGYATVVSTVLAGGTDKLPDVIQPGAYGIAALAEEGAIIPLDDYLDLIPNVVAAVGEDRMSSWRSADGHIYAIPTIVNVPGSQSMTYRKDWALKLKEMGVIDFETPTTWEQWKAFWYGVRDNDVNGNGDTTDEIPLVMEMGESGERALHALLNAFGIKASNDAQFCVLDDGTYTMVYDHPNYRSFLTEAQKLYADGIIDPEFATRKQADMYNTMSANLCASCFTWAQMSQTHTEELWSTGVEDALYECCAPITGPEGESWLQERQAVTNLNCITAKAAAEGKVENLMKFYNWQFSEEGINLYNYGIEGLTYTVVDGQPTMNTEIVKNGFTDYRTIGMEFEPFGGMWQTSAFMQCLFAGETLENLNAAYQSFWNGLNDEGVNAGHYYAMPPTLETSAYNEYRGELIIGSSGVCALRDQCVAGQVSVDDFFAKYEELKSRGLDEVIEEGNEAYQKIK
ncbi:MAG: extracellular solute-binding protein [Clostridia bacterium]|nr:extracellular solute-binding protein [Clostridia bacterium]